MGTRRLCLFYGVGVILILKSLMRVGLYAQRVVASARYRIITTDSFLEQKCHLTYY